MRLFEQLSKLECSTMLKIAQKEIYIYITDPLILYCCVRAIDSETVRPRRLRIGMWPLPMGAGDLGRMRSASTASEAVGGCSTLWCYTTQI